MPDSDRASLIRKENYISYRDSHFRGNDVLKKERHSEGVLFWTTAGIP